ncbi:hypothetical protein KP509_06G048200 [Ceratopteris richardii]|uniref:Phospholipase A2 family protein n=1 Tax=Ceratopteris richardii TaxID=49495 RepID=A0A8T2UMF2_CERRI|nr:hypothetical protein KP509_06G048200 [Ceratopteris richardii]
MSEPSPSPKSSSTRDVLLSSTSTSSSSPKKTALEEVNDGVHQIPPFSPYSAQVPWHTGIRAFLSNIFPKYGNYCGPNWSSGRSHGSLLWDKPPIDWLDHCCFCHDVGYDTHNQEKLYKADLEFLECLQKKPYPMHKQQRIGFRYFFYRTGECY